MPKRKSYKRNVEKHQRKGSFKRLKAFLLKRFRLLVVSLGLVSGVFIVFILVYLFQYFRTNLTQASSGTALTAGRLDVNHDFNLLLFKIEDLKNPTAAITGMALLNFQVQKNKLFVLPLSANESLANPAQAGRLGLFSLYGLSSLSQNKSGPKFSLEKTISLQLGLPLDGVFYTDEAGYAEMGITGQFLTQGHDFLSNARLSSRILASLGAGLKTNLDLKSLLALSKFLIFNFPKNAEVLKIDRIGEGVEKYDAKFRDKLVNQEILEERASVIILNGTAISGLATSLGRLVSNVGFTLLSAGNAPWSAVNSQSFMIVRSASSYTVLRLAKILGIDDVRKPDSMEGDPNFNRFLRADIVIVAGLDQVQ